MKKFLLLIWNGVFDFFVELKTKVLLFKDNIYKRNHSTPNVMSIDQTIDYIIENNCSVARYGDGEIKLACNNDISFQKASENLSKMLREPIRVKNNKFLPCIVDCFDNTDDFTREASQHWKKHMSVYRKAWYALTCNAIHYGNSFISRPYMQYENKSSAGHIFEKIKKIWDNRDVIIVEGEQSRLGTGNDLFNNVSSLKRILVPVKNAFFAYDKILKCCVENREDNCLFLLALGPTATVLAYELYKNGCQAVDIGHIDIEYEWFLCGATHKQPVKNKYVNEAGDKNTAGDLTDGEYLSQIIAKIQ